MVNIAIFIDKTASQSDQSLMAVLFVVSDLILWACLRYTRFKKHISKLIMFLLVVQNGTVVNLAIRNMLPFGLTVDMSNLAFF